jgi:putative membrane protein
MRDDGRMGVYDVGDEPDPRYSLANERTFLAWVRTTLAMLAGSVALHSLGIPAADGLRNALVAGLALFGGLMTALAFRRWARVERAMRRHEPLPRFGLGAVVTVVLVLVSLLLAVTLVV